MSTKIEYEDGSVYFEPEPSETEDLEYVYLLCDDYENGGYYPYRFFNRMCNGLIKAPFSKLQFMNNDEIVSTLEGYELDVEKFWFALLYIYDITMDFGINAADASKTDYDILVEIEDYLELSLIHI